MRINTAQFCTLATSPDWQTWLYNYDSDLYSTFIVDLRGARGCSANRTIMERLLDVIDKLGGTAELAKFLQSYHPQVIKVDPKPHTIDQHFQVGVLTFPRRHIIEAPRAQLNDRIQDFLSDKIKYEYFIIGRRAYVEYLTTADEEIMDRIPSENWILAGHKNEEDAKSATRRR